MTVDEKLAAMEQRLRMYCRQLAANSVQVAPVKVTSSDGISDGVEGRPTDESYQRSVHRIQHAGFRSRPPAEAQAVVLLVEGGAGKAVQVAEDDGRGDDVALEAGEVKIYSPAKPAARIWIDKNGVIHIDADSGQDAIVNNGSKKIHRVDDHADVGTLTLTVVAPGVLSGTYVDPDGTPTVIASGVPIPLKAKATEGADHFKG